ncbi:unnamed protein product, partial [Vitis vinifera]
CLIFIAIELFSSFKPLNQTSCSSCYNCHSHKMVSKGKMLQH